MFIFYSMSESSLIWTFDPPEADKCLLASGKFDVHLSKQHVNSALVIGSLFFHSTFDVGCSMSESSLTWTFIFSHYGLSGHCKRLLVFLVGLWWICTKLNW